MDKLYLIILVICFFCDVHGATPYDNCLQKTIEIAEEEANVIFTGTIRDLYEDADHPDMMKAKVEVKRVMKGSNVINTLPEEFISRRKTITIDGLGDPHICHSYARKYDTRIFLANRGSNGELKLNSSLVRLTLNNIIRADAAVQDTAFEPKPVPPKGKSACDTKFCAFGATCVENTANQEAECICQESCSTMYTPVCGSDGVTYTNECNLKKASCTQRKRIVVAKSGSCSVKDPCSDSDCTFGAQCIRSKDGLTFRCECPERCHSYGDTVDSKPVCGSDGRDYANICYLRKHSCEVMKDIQVKYDGKCDPCNGYVCTDSQICQLNGRREPMCRCNTLCTLEFAPVCGSDGRTYSNECILRVEACKKRKEISAIFDGECSTGENPCDSLSCQPAKECRVDRTGQASCVCPPDCEEIWSPVCGSDGKTYSSECHMKQQACVKSLLLTVQYAGQCGSTSPCNNYPCDYDSKCVIVNEKPACQCPQCSEEFAPVCGTDGVSYNNYCKLKVENCEQRTSVQIKYKGLCKDVCDGVNCDHYKLCKDDGKGMAQCVCPDSCVQVHSPVCGTDGVTYPNECELQLASCRKEQYIIVASHGSCDLCEDKICKFGGRCENGKCVCPQDCGTLREPVCASDGQTYSNQCEMKAHACKQGFELEVSYSGECEESSGSGDHEMCDDTTCRFGGVCKYDEEGPVGCVCNFNCPAVRNPVCGSDGRIYGNDCHMREEACRAQQLISESLQDNCEDIDEELCDGNPPLVNKRTGQEFDCESGKETCPAGSYCHMVGVISRCCSEEQPVRSCAETAYGCCPDGKTNAPGPDNAGCPMKCGCNQLGSLSTTCDPSTMQCECKPGVGGQKCDRCDQGFWGLPLINDGRSGCTPCACDLYGSVRDDCEQMSGRCSCKPGITGQKCNKCKDGTYIGSDGKCSGAAQPLTSCNNLKCDFGAVCKMTHGEARCTCPTDCPMDTSTDQVCGSDGQTYGSRCQLNQIACRESRVVTVEYMGQCRPAVEDEPPKRKTTRHINHPTRQPPRYGLIGDVCRSDGDCHVKNSFCKSDLCACDDMYEPSMDSKYCQANLCTNNPCKNGGSCMSEPRGDLKCVCPLGFRGPLCEEEVPLTTSVVTSSPDIILTTHAVDYLGDFGGESTYTVPSFNGDSYLQLKKLHHVNLDITIEMEFSTANPDGILLYSAQSGAGSGDFISLSLKDGFVEFRYDLGSGVAILKSAEKVTLNTFHKVTAKRHQKEGMLRLNHGQEVAGSSPGTLQSLNLQTDLYLGSVPQANKEIFKNIDVNVGFVGCIESLKIKAKDKIHDYELFHPGSMDILTGADISECGENPCSGKPCENGGTCTTIDSDTYECRCREGFTGKKCEKSELSTACNPSPCVGGGTCFSVSDQDYFCTCPTGREGTNCQLIVSTPSDITVPQFNRDAYIQLPVTRHMARTFVFELWFLTKSPTGMILYTSQENNPKGDFVALMLVNGYLEFRFDLGGGIANITSPTRIQMHQWHKVRITRTNRHGTMQVDDGNDVEGHSQGEMQELNVPSYVYIGGYPYEYNPDAGMTVGFNGAVQRVYESGLRIDNLLTGSLSNKGVKQFHGPPCSDNPCLNEGVCVPELNQYKCRCKMGYSGDKCEIVFAQSDSNLPVKFNGKAHHKYRNKISVKEKNELTNKFEVKFQTYATNGLLLVIHKSHTVEGDYLSMAVVNGQLEVSYNLGKQPADQLHFIRSDVTVSDNKWHTVVFERNGRQGTLTIDDHKPVQDQSLTGVNQLDTDGTLWVGGASTVPSGLPVEYYTGFEGCIEYILIDGQKLNMAEDRLDSNNLQYCTS